MPASTYFGLKSSPPTHIITCNCTEHTYAYTNGIQTKLKSTLIPIHAVSLILNPSVSLRSNQPLQKKKRTWSLDPSPPTFHLNEPILVMISRTFVLYTILLLSFVTSSASESQLQIKWLKPHSGIVYGHRDYILVSWHLLSGQNPETWSLHLCLSNTPNEKFSCSRLMGHSVERDRNNYSILMLVNSLNKNDFYIHTCCELNLLNLDPPRKSD